MSLNPEQYKPLFCAGSMGRSSADVLQQRRRALLDDLDSWAVFYGIPHLPGHQFGWYASREQFLQEPSLVYLTGLNIPGCTLILDPARKPGDRVVLFLPPRDARREFWDGETLGADSIELENSDHGAEPNPNMGSSSANSSLNLDGVLDFGKVRARSRSEAQGDSGLVYQLTGISRILPDSLLDTWIQKRLQTGKEQHMYCYFHEYTGGGRTVKKEDYLWELSRKLKRKCRKENVELKSIAATHLRRRVVNDRYVLSDMRRAQKITRQAFETILGKIQTFRSETELSAALEFELLQKSEWGLAFPTICAAEKNACTLHYTRNCATIPSNSLILLDFGVRSACGLSDISRTIPASGKFNPLQKLLYAIVLEVQKNNEKRVRPGARIADLNRSVWLDMEHLLKQRFTDAGGKMHRAYPLKSSADNLAAPHGVSHLIGIQVHEGDPFRLYQNIPLQEGMVLSNEPGLYGYFELKIAGKWYKEWIGIRIEDDLLVTKGGCTNLSRSIPKEVHQIEMLASGDLQQVEK